MKVLLRANATADVRRSIDGCTALHLAASVGHLQVDVLIYSRMGLCGPPLAIAPLAIAPQHHILSGKLRETQVVQALMDAGIPADDADYDKDTPLHVAAIYGHLKVKPFLTRALHVNLLACYGLLF